MKSLTGYPTVKCQQEIFKYRVKSVLFSGPAKLKVHWLINFSKLNTILYYIFSFRDTAKWMLPYWCYEKDTLNLNLNIIMSANSYGTSRQL